MSATWVRRTNMMVGLLVIGMVALGCAKRTTIAAVLDEVKPGWTESMVKDRFPDMRVDKRPIQDDPEAPSDFDHVWTEGNDSVHVNCFLGIVDEVSVLSLNGGGSTRKVWGDSFQPGVDWLINHKTAKMRKDDAQESAEYQIKRNAEEAAQRTREAQIKAQEQAHDQCRSQFQSQLDTLESQIDAVRKQGDSIREQLTAGDYGNSSPLYQKSELLDKQFNDLIEKRSQLMQQQLATCGP